MIWKIKKDFLLIPAEWAETQPSARLAYFPSPSARGPGGPAWWKCDPASLSGAPASPVEFNPLSEDLTR
jgi:hypothetical protein